MATIMETSERLMRKPKGEIKSEQSPPKDAIVPEKREPYYSYSIHRKAGTGGLFIMRKLTILGDRVVSVEESVEDFASILIARVEAELNEAIQ